MISFQINQRARYGITILQNHVVNNLCGRQYADRVVNYGHQRAQESGRGMPVRVQVVIETRGGPIQK